MSPPTPARRPAVLLLHDGTAPHEPLLAQLRSADTEAQILPLSQQSLARCLEPHWALVILDRSSGAAISEELSGALADALRLTGTPALMLIANASHQPAWSGCTLDWLPLPADEAQLGVRLELLLKLARSNQQLIALGQALADRDEQLRVAHAGLARAEAQAQAGHDPLTNLPNRALFMDRLDQSVQRADRAGSRLALVVVDVARFTPVSAAYGQQLSDALLQAFAARLAGAVRRSDTVGRIGRDEFALIAEDVPAAEAVEHTAEKLSEVLSLPYPLQMRPGEEAVLMSVGVHTGSAMYPFQADDAADLLDRAEAALHRQRERDPDQSA